MFKTLDAIWPVLTMMAQDKKLTSSLDALRTLVGNIEPMLANPAQAKVIYDALVAAGWMAPLVG